jgi:predicted Rossmann-fold nucleotide-binding protein
VDFARCISQYGFMVLTGAGGGIMQAGNEDAGRENSFGLNIQLPFEQGANP